MSKTVFKRVVLKLSGEALAGENGFGINTAVINHVADQIIELAGTGIEIGIVIGAGNIWRGRQGTGMDRTTADHMGMLATVINSLAMQDALEQKGYKCRVMSAIAMDEVAEPYIRRRAMRHLEKGRIVIFACGTGNPFFSTDTTAALRAAEIEADVILLAKNIDAVYDCDPRKNPHAKKYSSITYMDVLSKGLQVMDSTAITLCMENNIPLRVFALNGENNIMKVVAGENIGTIVAPDAKTVYSEN